MATNKTAEKSTAVSKREALDRAGTDQRDYTKATTAKYTVLQNGAAVSRDFSTIDNPIDRAFAIEGFLNKAGHAYNKATDRKNPDGKKAAPTNAEVDAALAEFAEIVGEGGWFHREGGVSDGAVIRAYAALKRLTEDDARARFNAATDTAKDDIRSHPQVKAEIKRQQLAKLEAAAAGSKALGDL